MKNVLITGCNGLVGFELAKLLLNVSEHRVFGLSRSKPEISDANFTHLPIDFTEPGFESALPDKVDIIYHLAQSEHFREFPGKAKNIFDVNTYSTLALLEYCRKKGGKKFVYASSGGVYGTAEHGFTEEDSIASNDDLGFYLGTKLCSEILVGNYSNFFDVVIGRLFFVYGKRQRKTMLIPRLIDNIRAGNPVSLQGEAGIRINPIHVSDAALALQKLLDLKGSHKINIAGSEILSLKEIAEIIGAATGNKPVFSYTSGTAKNLLSDIGKMKKLLVNPKVTLNEGIKEFF